MPDEERYPNTVAQLRRLSRYKDAVASAKAKAQAKEERSGSVIVNRRPPLSEARRKKQKLLEERPPLPPKLEVSESVLDWLRPHTFGWRYRRALCPSKVVTLYCTSQPE